MVGIDMAFGVLVALIGLGGIVRAWAIQMGYFKSVLLRVFENYDHDASLYNSLFQFAVWMGIVLAGVLIIAARFIELSAQAHIPMLLAFIIAYIAHANARFFQHHLPFLMPYPRWYISLLARTTTEERRRIAYMWLHLPRHSQRLMNSQDVMFATWADLVIIASV